MLGPKGTSPRSSSTWSPPFCTFLDFFCFAQSAHFSFFAFHAQPALVHFFSFFCFLQETPEEATHCPFFHSQPPAFLQGFLSAFGRPSFLHAGAAGHGAGILRFDLVVALFAAA